VFLINKRGHTFAEEVLTKPAEDGNGPDGHGSAYSFDERFAVFGECLDRSYGRPAQASTELKKVIHEIRWLPPDPNDRSVEAVPQPYRYERQSAGAFGRAPPSRTD
jgi:hypothetical protein